MEIAVSRDIQKDPKLSEVFEGKVEYRGKWIPVLNIKKILKFSGRSGAALLIVRGAKGMLGILVDAVIEIIDAERGPMPMPKGVLNPTLNYYSGIIRHKDGLVLLLNEDGLLP